MLRMATDSVWCHNAKAMERQAVEFADLFPTFNATARETIRQLEKERPLTPDAVEKNAAGRAGKSMPCRRSLKVVFQQPQGIAVRLEMRVDSKRRDVGFPALSGRGTVTSLAVAPRPESDINAHR